jgi:hypothetical protein
MAQAVPADQYQRQDLKVRRVIHQQTRVNVYDEIQRYTSTSPIYCNNQSTQSDLNLTAKND